MRPIRRLSFSLEPLLACLLTMAVLAFPIVSGASPTLVLDDKLTSKEKSFIAKSMKQ